MKTCHGFDFTQVSADQQLDFYSQVKAVNYIRKQVCIVGVGNVYDHSIELLDGYIWALLSYTDMLLYMYMYMYMCMAMCD